MGDKAQRGIADRNKGIGLKGVFTKERVFSLERCIYLGKVSLPWKGVFTLVKRPLAGRNPVSNNTGSYDRKVDYKLMIEST